MNELHLPGEWLIPKPLIERTTAMLGVAQRHKLTDQPLTDAEIAKGITAENMTDPHMGIVWVITDEQPRFMPYSDQPYKATIKVSYERGVPQLTYGRVPFHQPGRRSKYETDRVVFTPGKYDPDSVEGIITGYHSFITWVLNDLERAEREGNLRVRLYLQ